MAKTLSERIAERLEKSAVKPKQSNKVIFLALRDEIAKALEDGWTVKVVWQTLREEKRITFSYQTFNRYVQVLIKSRLPAQDKPVSEAPEKPSKSQGIKEFKFNANPKKEDLI